MTRIRETTPSVEAIAKEWAADDRLWNTQEVVEANLIRFADAAREPLVLLLKKAADRLESIHFDNHQPELGGCAGEHCPTYCDAKEIRAALGREKAAAREPLVKDKELLDALDKLTPAQLSKLLELLTHPLSFRDAARAALGGVLAYGKGHAAAREPLLELAWGVIANAGGGDWEKESKEWQEAAAKWRDQYQLKKGTEI